jgi:hypothetical protein
LAFIKTAAQGSDAFEVVHVALRVNYAVNLLREPASLRRKDLLLEQTGLLSFTLGLLHFQFGFVLEDKNWSGSSPFYKAAII